MGFKPKAFVWTDLSRKSRPAMRCLFLFPRPPAPAPGPVPSIPPTWLNILLTVTCLTTLCAESWLQGPNLASWMGARAQHQGGSAF